MKNQKSSLDLMRLDRTAIYIMWAQGIIYSNKSVSQQLLCKTSIA